MIIDAQYAENMGRQVGSRLAKQVIMPIWPEEVRTEEYIALWENFCQGLCDQVRVDLIRR